MLTLGLAVNNAANARRSRHIALAGLRRALGYMAYDQCATRTSSFRQRQSNETGAHRRHHHAVFGGRLYRLPVGLYAGRIRYDSCADRHGYCLEAGLDDLVQVRELRRARPLSALAALPRLTKAAGVGLFTVDLAAQLWTVGLLFAAAGPARTLGWRALLGAFLLGFLGLMGLARFVGRPVIVALGNTSLFAAAIWVPITEEIFKLLPLAFMLFFALRRSDSRPSLVDMVLLTGCAAAGFAVSENASYGRGVFSLTAAPLVSLLSPATNRGAAYGWSMVQTGHLLHSALIALAIGLVVLYRGRLPRWIARAWMVPAVAVGAVLLEHCSQNAIVTGGLNRYVGEFCMIVTLGGRLCALLLALGVGYVMTIEWRAFTPLSPSKEWLVLSPQEASRRAGWLALLQVRGPHA